VIPREELIRYIDSIGDNDLLSLSQVARSIDENLSTVRGWASRRKDFPVFEEGARSARHYQKPTILKLCLYGYTLRISAGVKPSGDTVLNAFENIDISTVVNLLRESHQKYVAFFNH